MYLNQQIISENTSHRELFYYLLDNEGNVIKSQGNLIAAGVLPAEDVLESSLPFSIIDKYNDFVSSDEKEVSHRVAICSNGDVIMVSWKMCKFNDGKIEFIGNKLSQVEDVGLIPIEKLPYPIAVIQKNGEIIRFNHSFIDYFLESKIIVQPLRIQDIIKTNVLSPEHFNYSNMIKSDANSRAVLCHFKGSENNQTFLLNLIPITYNKDRHFMAAIKDLTQFVEIQQSLEMQNEELRKQVQEEFELNKSYELELLKKNRLESLGEIASGIFHELNQPLTHLSLKIDNMFDKWKTGSVNEEYLFSKTEQIQRQILRMRGIIDEMKQFSSVPEKRDQLVNVKQVLNCALEDVSYLDVSGLILSVKQIDDICIKGSANELEQVFVNVITNSIQSLISKQKNEAFYRPKLKIVVKTMSDLVYVNIIDNGLGAKDEHLQDMFKPFFTTKKSDGGTGLGLFIINNLMRKMKGTIAVKTNEGKYFKTTLSFPIVKNGCEKM